MDPLDAYILAKLRELIEETTRELDDYDFFDACSAIRSFLDALTNWYIRRSRDRFWEGDPAAFDTLYTVLVTLCRVMAPLLPLVSEYVHRGLTGEPSVHLTDWPAAAEFSADHDLVAAMDRVRDVCSAALSVRKREGRRVRLPLASMTIASPDADRLEPFRSLIADEVNVKDVVLSTDVAAHATSVLQVVPAVAGPRLGGDVQKVIRAVKSGDWHRQGDTVVAGGIALEEGEYSLRLMPADEHASASLAGTDGVIVLDLDLTPELEAEGLARDLIRMVQQARRDAGLYVSDRISLTIAGPVEWVAAAETHEALIAGETLATSFSTATDGALGEPNVTVARV